MPASSRTSASGRSKSSEIFSALNSPDATAFPARLIFVSLIIFSLLSLYLVDLDLLRLSAAFVLDESFSSDVSERYFLL